METENKSEASLDELVWNDQHNENISNIIDLLEKMVDSGRCGADHRGDFFYSSSNCLVTWMDFLKDRIEVAYKRDIDELRECLSEAIDELCRHSCLDARGLSACSHLTNSGECNHESGYCKAKRWRKALEGISK